VVLTQNKNVFRGERAEIDMNKGISRLLPSPGPARRSTIQPKQKSIRPRRFPPPARNPCRRPNGALALSTVPVPMKTACARRNLARVDDLGGNPADRSGT